MSTVNRAFQELDPLGALTGRPVTIGAAVGIPVFAAVMTWLNRFDVDNWMLAALALLAITGCGATLAWASSPLHAPFTLRMHIVVTGLAVAAYVLSAASMWQSNQYVRDDWGPIAIGLVLLSLSQFRPPKELTSTGLVIALFAGVFTLSQAHSFATGVAPIDFSIVAMTPILALSLASAAFGRLLIDGLDRWRRRARRAVSAFSDQNSDWIARSVQQDRVTILNQDVVPFFAEVQRNGVITEADRVRAREISDAVRAIMVAEADRSWLDIIVAQSVGEHTTVIDPARLAIQMSTEQRTAVRALIVALTGHAAFLPEDFSFTIDSKGDTRRARLVVTMNTIDSVIRSEFAPYFAVMRIVFSELKVEFSHATLTLRFSYDQR